MAGILGLFGIGARGGGKQASVTLRAQTSIDGRPRPIGAGQNRLAGNILWYGDYHSSPVKQQGGKGGAGGTGKGAPQSYQYSASFIVAIGETIDEMGAIINGNQFDFYLTPSAEIIAALEEIGVVPTYGNTYNATIKEGGYAQNAWNYLTTAHPTQALAYRGISYAAFPNLGLGQNPALPNFNFEVRWPLNTDIPALGPDANPADWVEAFLTNADWGAGYPAALLAPLTALQSYARATGMLISPLLESQVSAESHLNDLMQALGCEFVQRDGLLTVVPYADSAVTGNGYTFTPETTPVYDLVETDFMAIDGGAGDAPSRVNVDRKDPTKVPNLVRLEYVDRATMYNPVTIYEQNDAAVIAAGRPRPTDVRRQDFFALAGAASTSATIQIRREGVLGLYRFRLRAQFALLTSMDIVTLTEPEVGLAAQPVRIKEVKENADGSFTFDAEDFLGTVGAPRYVRQRPLGTGRNNNQDPGGVLDPVFIEPPEQLGNGLYIWTALTGADLSIWGGAEIWTSSDPVGSYQLMGKLTGATRMGILTATLDTFPEAPSGQTVDTVNTLAVDLTESQGELTSGSDLDMTALDTACWVDGEIIAYQNATLTDSYEYDLEPMVRGAYATPISSHAAGADFIRLDELLFKFPFTQDRIGKTIYVKFRSFNIYGGGLQGLDDVPAYSYVITGAALSAPLPDVENFRASYQDKTSTLTWDEVTDFRPIRYEIRQGDSWDAGTSFGTLAHPPFTTYGDGTYWVKAISQPVAGLTVYSENAASYVVAGSVLPGNTVASYAEAPDWTGTFSGPGAKVGDNFETTDSGTVAYYQIPNSHFIETTYDRPVRIEITWKVAGVPIGDDILTNPDILTDTDILKSSATQYVGVWAELFVAFGESDVYALLDAYAVPDIYDTGETQEWVKYAPGEYVGHQFAARLAIISNDPATTASAVEFTIRAYVETRIDHLVNYALGAGGETFAWTPDAAADAAAFQGGLNGASLPLVIVAIQNAQAGDYYVVDPAFLTLSAGKIQCLNAGVGVARTISVTVAGW